jgi:aryl-alcohol dehydrogenase-like predicted oxidoreductase
MSTDSVGLAVRQALRAAPAAFGTINLPWLAPSAALDLMDYAIAHGVRVINFTDAKYDGRSEAIFGEWLVSVGGCPDLTIVAEVSGPDMGVPHDPNLEPQYVLSAVRRTLDRLHLPKLQMLLLPRPSFTIPVAATLEAVAQLLESGTIESYGTSTFPAWKLMEVLVAAERLGMAGPVADESPYNVLDRRIENELVPFCLAYDVEIMAWAPLAQGLLAGRYRASSAVPADSRAAMRGGVYRERVTPEGIARSEAFGRIAQEAGLSPAQLALAWVRARDGITMPVVGFRTRRHIDEALRGSAKLPEEVMERIDKEVNPAGSVVVSFFNSAPWMKMRISTE